jgi:DNA-binding GntR family transcriptional regulator
MLRALTDWIVEVAHPWLFGVLERTTAPATVLGQHRALLAALEKRDPARAERAMEDQLLALRAALRVEGGGRPPRPV